MKEFSSLRWPVVAGSAAVMVLSAATVCDMRLSAQRVASIAGSSVRPDIVVMLPPRRTLTLHMVSSYGDLPAELSAILDSTPGALVKTLHVGASAPGAPASAVSADITLSIPGDENKRQSL